MTSPAREIHGDSGATAIESASEMDKPLAGMGHDAEVGVNVDVSAQAVTALRKLGRPVAELVEIVDQLPAAYRPVAFAEFLRFVLDAQRPSSRVRQVAKGSQPSQAALADSPESNPEQFAPGLGFGTALELVESALGLSRGALRRVLQIDAEKNVQVLTRVEGKSTSERQVRLAQVICYVREKAFGEMKTDIETLRSACIAQGQYDPANFAANFRRDATIVDAPTPGSKERLFILSRDGVESASALLRQLAEI